MIEIVSPLSYSKTEYLVQILTRVGLRVPVLVTENQQEAEDKAKEIGNTAHVIKVESVYTELN